MSQWAWSTPRQSRYPWLALSHTTQRVEPHLGLDDIPGILEPHVVLSVVQQQPFLQVLLGILVYLANRGNTSWLGPGDWLFPQPIPGQLEMVEQCL